MAVTRARPTSCRRHRADRNREGGGGIDGGGVGGDEEGTSFGGGFGAGRSHPRSVPDVLPGDEDVGTSTFCQSSGVGGWGGVWRGMVAEELDAEKTQQQ